VIEQLSVQYGVKEVCWALRVSRSAFYRWKNGPESPRVVEQRELAQKIERVFKGHAQRYGSPRVTRVLRQEGLSVGENRVARLMRQQQLAARQKRAFRPKTTLAGNRAEPNRIANLVPERPDQIWVSDITYVATAEGWLYLAVILDLFSRRVVGWKLDHSLEAGLVHQALQNALVLRQPPAGLYFHSDRGCQYSSHLVRKPLEVIQAIRSMSGLGNCYENANAEAFFSTLKTECFPLSHSFQSKAQARSEIFEYIEGYYNNQRLHSALGYQSPCNFETQFKQVIDNTTTTLQFNGAVLEDRALRGRNSSAKAALQTAGGAVSSERPAGCPAGASPKRKIPGGLGDRVPRFH
jgi:putative transposase